MNIQKAFPRITSEQSYFNMQEIWKKQSFINIWCPFEGHKHDRQKPVETICHMCEFISSLEEITTIVSNISSKTRNV